MMNRFLIFSFTLFTLIVTGLVYAFLNGSSCRYSISLYVVEDDRYVFMTCYRGKVVALQTRQNEQGEILSKWKVEARHFRLSSQSIYFVYSRTPLVHGSQVDANDRFNEISSGFKLLFYNMQRSGDKDVYIFQEFPRYYVHKGTIDGVLDAWDDTNQL
ncbi:TPA: hypothetical protein I7234_15835 [Vibrio vulnificus]|nr:hypothetical protein [Vibrio vulnificus]HAS6026708.1 hypothetical protein [Vibrio vulnificus]HAS6036187.1 hypothetical protein [Vibrio vulnificus]HAS6152760.1 hypothetical protein [Vibrio vulnificus]HAS6353691.1 hypothetical protein [Vibrio vulnificus]